MTIVPRKTYRIKGDSAYFKEKYGTPNPLFIVEDKAVLVFRTDIIRASLTGNWAARLFMERVAKEKPLKPFDPDDASIYYGKVQGLGECVFGCELEELES